MSAIITWMILEKCLDVGRQYFFIDFLFWHSICEEIFYDLIHLLSILLKIQSI